MTMPEQTEVKSTRFQLVTLSDGIYAAIAVLGGGALCNAGIVDLGDRTVVFDTFNTPLAARELRATAERLTGRPATWIINSHWHGDHVIGNQVFVGTPIIATERTRQLMQTSLRAELEQDRQDLPAFIHAQEDALEAEQDDEKRSRLASRLAENRTYAAAISDIVVVPPDSTFEGRMTLYGTERAAQLITLGAGHTESDAFLYLPEERIAFMGDLAFLDMHPWLPDGDPHGWVRTLEQVERLPIEAVVPGHGPVGTATSLALTREYIVALQRIASEIAASGGSADDAVAAPVPAQFDTWGFAHFFEPNVRFLYARAASSAP